MALESDRRCLPAPVVPSGTCVPVRSTDAPATRLTRSRWGAGSNDYPVVSKYEFLSRTCFCLTWRRRVVTNAHFLLCRQRLSAASRLLLLRTDLFSSRFCVSRLGDFPALPLVHMECVFSKASLRGNASAHHSCCLRILHSHGPDQHEVSAKLSRPWEIIYF